MEALNRTSSIVQDPSEDDPFVYSSENLCWVRRNMTGMNLTKVEEEATYCYYGLALVIPMSTVLVLSMVLAIVGNSMVILTIVRHRGMRTRTNLLLANLAVADILVAVLDMPFAIITIISGDWIFSDTFCDFNGFAVGLGLMLSTHTLMWISIHKFISITRPFSRTMTPRKISMMIMAAWAWAIIYNLTPTNLIGLTDTKYKLGASQCGPVIPKELNHYIHSGMNTLLNLVGPFSIMSYCYYRIFKEVKDHLKRMRGFADVSACSSLIEQKQITETLCIVLAVYLMFWMPYIGYSLTLAFLGKAYVPVICNPIAYMCGYMNSACNPIIYALRSPSFRQGFSDIICGNNRQGRRGSMYGGSLHSRTVISFRRPFFGGEGSGNGSQNHRNRRILSRNSARKNSFAVISTVDNSLAHVSYDQKVPHNMGMKRNHHDNVDSRNRGVAYKNMNNAVNGKMYKDINNHPEIESEDRACCSACLSEETANQKLRRKISDSDLLVKNTQDVYLEDNPIDIQRTQTDKSPVMIDSFPRPKLESNGLGEHHASFNQQVNKMCSHECKASASQPDVTVLPSQNLDICIDGSRISSSNREILVTTLEIRNNQIRSVSVGDVRVTCSVPQPAVPSPPSSVEVKETCVKKDFPQRVANLKRPIVWQPSVDYLYDSPNISRQKSHVRKMAVDSKFHEVGNYSGCRNMHKEKKSSTSSTGSHRSLGVGSLITSVKKSITDLFHLDEDDPVKSFPEISSSSEVKAAGLSDDRAEDSSSPRGEAAGVDGGSCGTTVKRADFPEGKVEKLSNNTSDVKSGILLENKTKEDDEGETDVNY